jgi:multidrug resistance efflux pump
MEKIVENNGKGQGSSKKNILFLAIAGFVIAGAVAGFYFFMSRTRIYVEKSQIIAPEIALSSSGGGKLQKLFVSPGDKVAENEVVAEVDQELVKAKKTGIIISTQNNIGKNFLPNEEIVSMIEPSDLRVVSQVEEDKGFSDIKVGQRAFFTVDAYGAKQFDGIVDEISPTYRQGDVVFNISSQRQVNDFNVKIRFDEKKYPELKNGMSAKAWIYED